jgi:cell division protein FtsN
MSRDQKPGASNTTARAPGGGGRRGMNPMFLGIIIGLLLGVGLALGLAIWLNRANNPFVEKSKPVEALPTIPPKPAAAASGANPATGQAAGKTDGEKPRFEFYQILPGEKGEKIDRGEKGIGSAEKMPKPESVAAKAHDFATKPSPEAKPENRTEAKPTGGEVYMLQAGAFQSQTDAENMKAKVAFAGFEAVVRPVNLPEKGTLYRVRLGPYKSLEEVNRIKATLSQNGVGAAVVKGTD